MRVSRVYMASN